MDRDLFYSGDSAVQKLLRGLNPEQREAVLTTEGPLLILAGAGSGKTKTVVHRIAYLLKRGIPPERILAVSFTNRAVREMAERIASLVNSKKIVKKMTLSTFHSLGVKILREEYRAADLPEEFAIYDTADQLALLKKSMRQLRIDEEQYPPKQLLASISNLKNRMLQAGEIPDPLLRDLYLLYNKNLNLAGAVDFDDLLLLPVKMFKKNPKVREKWERRFQYITIDEYQDTNRVQLELSKFLAKGWNNICAVGDDDQSIYGWRGSDVSIIRHFTEHFPGAKVISLTQNYRSTQIILDAANAVIAKSRERYPKRLWTQRTGGDLIAVHVAEDPEREARLIIDKLLTERMKRVPPRPWKDFAIMFRTNAQSRVFEEICRRERIPYRLIGGLKFFERKEIRDIISYFRVFVNPHDEPALRRIINLPPRGIGDQTIKILSKYATQKGVSLFTACSEVDAIPQLSPKQKQAVSKFVRLILDFRRKFSNTTELESVAEELIESIDYIKYLLKEHKNLTEAKKREENVRSLIDSLEEYRRRSDNPSLREYIDENSLDPTGEPDREKEDQRDQITLITIHGSKGMEFPVVFIAGFEDGLLPHIRPDEPPDLEEERRLCYVAITRAKEKLFISYAEKRKRFGRERSQGPSRFLGDIPKKLLSTPNSRKQREEELSEEEVSKIFQNIRALLSQNSRKRP